MARKKGNFPHMLRSMTKAGQPTNMLFFDTETTTYKTEKIERKKTFQSRSRQQTEIHEYNSKKLFQRVRLAHVIYIRKKYKEHNEKIIHYDCYSEKKLIDIIISHAGIKKPLYCFAANVGFDLAVSHALEQLRNTGWKGDDYISNGKALIIKMRKSQRTIIFLNVQQYCPKTVASMGEIVGYKKLFVDFTTCSIPELMKYCRRDTEIIMHFMRNYMSFISKHGLGRFAFTISGQAFNAYRHRFLKHKIWIHTKPKAIELERKAYYGGRTECFFIGKKTGIDTYKLDVNSMYPAIMKQNPMPINLRKEFMKMSVKRLSGYMNRYFCIADVNLNTDKPAFPYRYENKVIFQTGRFRTYLAQPELRYAIRQGFVTDVHQVNCYSQAIIFDDYVDFFYQLRKEYKNSGNAIYDQITKLLMVSLYGKFGQMGFKTLKQELPEPEPNSRQTTIDTGTGIKGSRVVLGNFEFMTYRKGNSFNAMVAIATAVTSYSRFYLWKLLELAGRENVFYTDTDSLFVNEIGYKNLDGFIDPDKLGALKLEETTNNLEIRGLKDYTFGGFSRTKGISFKAEKIEDDIYEQLQFPNMNSYLNMAGNEDYSIRTTRKFLNRDYTKGVVYADGSIKPFSSL